jgi:hypothetical protein
VDPKAYRRMVNSYARELGLSAKEITELMRGVTVETRIIKGLVGKPGPRDGRSRLVKLGITLIASPDPFTDPLGYVLLAAGLIKERRRQVNISDTYNRFRDITEEMQKMKQEISRLKIEL